jgi:NTE family protein
MVTSKDQSSEVPVTRIPTDPANDQPEPGIALCLSGGGYRAMLFHVGALWRLCEINYFPLLKRISSVSGGSITAAVLGLNWSSVTKDDGQNIDRFKSLVVAPIRALAGETIDAAAVLKGTLWFGTVADQVADAYRKHLFGNRTLQDFPDSPRFVVNATNVQSGALFRFSKPYAWDYRVGRINVPKIELAIAVGASSAFPPVLSPVTLNVSPSDFESGTGTDLQHPPFTEKVILSDGGVYDNLGLETAYKRYDTILASDGGGKMEAEGDPKKDWVHHAVRVNGIIDNQVRSLRKRQLIDSYQKRIRKGAYWGIRSNIQDYELAGALSCPHDKTILLANVATRLKELTPDMQERLINWGYAICDTAVRKHVASVPAPAGFPYPDAGV